MVANCPLSIAVDFLGIICLVQKLSQNPIHQFVKRLTTPTSLLPIKAFSTAIEHDQMDRFRSKESPVSSPLAAHLDDAAAAVVATSPFAAATDAAVATIPERS